MALHRKNVGDGKVNITGKLHTDYKQRILKYLYNNRDGEYHPVKKAFKKNKLPPREHLYNIVIELKTQEYIETGSIYEQRGLLDDKQLYPREYPDLTDEQHPYYNAKITTIGIELIEGRKKKRKWKTILIYAIVTLIVTVFGILIADYIITNYIPK